MPMPILAPRVAARALDALCRAMDAAEASARAARAAADAIGRRLLQVVEDHLVGLADGAMLFRWRILFRRAVLAARRYEAAARRLGVRL